MAFKLVFCVIFISMINSNKAECKCGNYVGYHCGDRSNDGSNVLKGQCKRNIVYDCRSINAVAIEKWYCSHCTKSVRRGTDFCTAGRECIWSFNFNMELLYF
jgi:hypothetical protein